MDSRIAIIGDGESIKGFAAVGIDIFECDDAEDARPLLRRVADGGEYGVIFLTERLFSLLEKERGRYAERMTPAIIPLPGVAGNTGIGTARLRAFVEKAVGSDIMFND